MSQDTLNPQKRSQGDFAARMNAESYFSDITILEQNKGVTEDDVLQALSVLNEKAGKIGACVIVLQPELIPANPAAPGPEYRVRVVIQVITAALFNDGDTGTGKTAEQISAAIRPLFHNWDAGWGTWTFAGMEPIKRESEGEVSYGVTFTRGGRDRKYPKLATPIIEPELAALPASVTLESEVDTEIWYTTDGSLPTPENDAATLYSAAIELTAPTTLRAIAYKTGRQPSNVAAVDYGTNVEFNPADFSDEFA